MILRWKITDKLSGITVDEFNKEYNGIYGFIKFQLEDDFIGFIPPDDVYLEGDNDILHCIKVSIRCGIALRNREYFETQLLSFNKLKICAEYDSRVLISLKDINDNTILWKHELSYDDVHTEIVDNFKRLHNYINKENHLLLEAKEIKAVCQLFQEYYG